MTSPLSSNTSSNLTPDYSKETIQIHARKAASATSSHSKGVILAKDSLEVPYEKQVGIQTNEAEAGRPFLPPLFRTRFVDDRKVEDLSRDYYQALRNRLPSPLKEKLEADETQIVLADRDPNLVALETSLKFEANLLALADQLVILNPNDEKALLRAQQYLALPEVVQKEILNYGSTVTRFLDHYLSTIGPNDPSYDILINVSNQVKEALELLNLQRGDKI